MLGVKYESSVYREIAQLGSVQPNMETFDNFKIKTNVKSQFRPTSV